MIDGMTQAPKFLRGLKAPRTVVLLYHRIDNLECDPQLSAVSPKHFSEHLQVLKEYNSKCFEFLATEKSRQKEQSNTVIVTFDDGYADNFENAYPLLKRFDTPATIFVTTGMVENRSEFWWDTLQRVFLTSTPLPSKLSLQLETQYDWDLSNCGSEARFDSAWNLLADNAPSKRHEIYRVICSFIRTAGKLQREKVLDAIKQWAPAVMQATDNGLNSDACKSLTASDILTMSKDGLVEIGSHTVNHSMLSALTTEEQLFELQHSRSYLQDIADIAVNSFAFPYGTKSDYTKQTQTLVAQAGYTTAASNIAEVVWSGTNRFEIPRLLVRDCNGEVFAKWLQEWFGYE